MSAEESPPARPKGRALRLQPPPASDEPFTGGPWFVAYCLGAPARARHRRAAVKRARAILRRAERAGDDPYPSALVLSQRMGLALEDLGRLAIGLQAAGTDDAFAAFRAARLEDIDKVFTRLKDEPALRENLKLPTRETVKDLVPDFQAALLAASSVLGKRWAAQWRPCAAGWPLLQRIAKGARHGSPLIKRELILATPGAGVLGVNAGDPFERWGLVVDTGVDEQTQHIDTTWLIADLSKKTLDRAEAAALDGIALAKAIAEGHAHRVRSVSRWGLPREVLRSLDAAHREVLERERR